MRHYTETFTRTFVTAADPHMSMADPSDIVCEAKRQLAKAMELPVIELTKSISWIAKNGIEQPPESMITPSEWRVIVEFYNFYTFCREACEWRRNGIADLTSRVDRCFVYVNMNEGKGITWHHFMR